MIIMELNKIYNEDCLTGIKKLPDNSIDLIVTSPEYYGAPMWENKISYADYLTFQEKVIDECIRVCKDGGFIIYNVSQMTVNSYPAKQTIGVYPIHLNIGNMMWAKGLTFREDIIWEKPDGYSNRFGVSINHPYSLCYAPNQTTEHILVFRKGKKKTVTKELQEENKIDLEFLKKYRSDVWRMNGIKDDIHPAPYPVELAKALIVFYSLKSGVVLDPFMGNGTTALAARISGRSYIGFELNEVYFKNSENRIRNELGMFI
jgi:DNA modification methylase